MRRDQPVTAGSERHKVVKVLRVPLICDDAYVDQAGPEPFTRVVV